jgi:hypothetical protein
MTIEPQETYSPVIAAIRERIRNGGYTTASMRAASARAHNGRPPPSDDRQHPASPHQHVRPSLL